MNPFSSLTKRVSGATTEFPVLLCLALLKFIFHLGVNALSAYGYFRDEFYYLECSQHLDWGYVDQPPLSIVVLAAGRLIFGDSLVALRLLPAAAGAITVYLGGLIARELGGGRFAQVLAALAAFSAPILLAMNSIYSMNSFDFVVWATAAILLLRILKTGEPLHWLLLGFVLGLGLLNKISVLWLGFGILAGLLPAPYRSFLKTRWPWISGLIAGVIFLPYIIWNINHDFAHLEFIRNATTGKYSSLTPVRFIQDMILQENPVVLPIWLGGVWYFFFTEKGRPFRILGIVVVAAFLVLIINQHSKAEYLAPAFPVVFAGGAVWMESVVAARAGLWKAVIAGAVAVSGMILTPLASPVLPVEAYIRYAEFLGIKPHTAETHDLAELPQFYADMFGWEELTATVLTVYSQMSPEEQKNSLIYGQNYGEAASVNFLGRGFGLPRAVSGHNNFFLWGPGRDSVDVVIIIGGRREDHLEAFEDVQLVARSQCRYCMPYENNLPIHVARGLKRPLKEIWPSTRHYE